MGQLGSQVALGLAFTAVLFGMIFTIIGIKMGAYAFDPMGFILVGPGLIAAGIAYLAWAEVQANHRNRAAQALKPMDVVFFDDPPPQA